MYDCVWDSGGPTKLPKRAQLTQYQIFVRRLFLSQPFAGASLRIDILDEVEDEVEFHQRDGDLETAVRLEWRN